MYTCIHFCVSLYDEIFPKIEVKQNQLNFIDLFGKDFVIFFSENDNKEISSFSHIKNKELSLSFS